MPMMDLIHRNILSSSSLRGKRRENEIWRLEKQQQESIRAGRGTRTTNMFHNHKGSVDDRDQDLIEFIHAFLADDKKRSKFKDDTFTPTPTVNPTVNPTADPNPTTPSIVGLTREHLVLSVDNEFIQVPLALFVDTLAKAFEQKLTSTALCFVADASSSLGLDIIHQIVNDSNAGMVRTLAVAAADDADADAVVTIHYCVTVVGTDCTVLKNIIFTLIRYYH
jgi:hypothetical protein